MPRGKRLIKRGKKRYLKKNNKLVPVTSKLSDYQIKQQLVRTGQPRKYIYKVPDNRRLLEQLNARRDNTYAEYQQLVKEYKDKLAEFKKGPDVQTQAKMEEILKSLKDTQKENINIANMYKELKKEVDPIIPLIKNPPEDIRTVGKLSVVSADKAKQLTNIGNKLSSDNKMLENKIAEKEQKIIETNKMLKKQNDEYQKMLDDKNTTSKELLNMRKNIEDEKKIMQSLMEDKVKIETELNLAKNNIKKIADEKEELNEELLVRDTLRDMMLNKELILVNENFINMKKLERKKQLSKYANQNKEILKNLEDEYRQYPGVEMILGINKDLDLLSDEQIIKITKNYKNKADLANAIGSVLRQLVRDKTSGKTNIFFRAIDPGSNIKSEQILRLKKEDDKYNEDIQKTIDENEQLKKEYGTIEELNEYIDSFQSEDGKVDTDEKIAIDINKNEEIDNNEKIQEELMKKNKKLTEEIQENLDALKEDVGKAEEQLGEGSEGLSTDEINRMMKNLMKEYKYDGFIGTYPADMIPIKAIEDAYLRDPTDIISMIVNTDNHDEEGEHWTALLFNFRDETIEYYDSYGRAAPHKLLEQVQEVLDKIEHPTYLKFKENMVQQQKYNTNTCGYHAMKFIIDRYNDVPFPICTNYDESTKGERNIKKEIKKFDKYM